MTIHGTDDNEVSDSEIKAKDPLEILNRSEGLIWSEGPFTNPHLCVRIRNVAHTQMVEVLTLAKKIE
jgi:hypothetical protein